MTTYCLSGIYHSYVYRRWLTLTAGIQYIWETRNLQRLSTFAASPDPYMYLVRGNDIVAKNDDYNALASLIAYVPTVSGSYYLIIRAYSKYSGGYCDVYQSVGGGVPSRIDSHVKFGGYPVNAHWKADERILTRNASGDTYLYLIHGNTVLRDDDSGDGLCSSIRPGYEGYGLAIVGSFSTYSEGTTYLCNYYQSYLDNPGEYDRGDDPNIVISEALFKFHEELRNQKESLEKLSYKDREARIFELRKKMISKEDIALLRAPIIKPSKEFVVAESRYKKLLADNEKRLSKLSRVERANEMKAIALKKIDFFEGLVPQE